MSLNTANVLYARFAAALAGCILILSCEDQDPDKNFLPVDWTELTHGNDTDPSYEVVFSQQEVKTLRIAMTSADWDAILADMQERTGTAFGVPTQGQGPGPGGGLDIVPGDPEYVALSVSFEEKEWYKVGFRLKGNSTLGGSWRRGIYKLPFRLNFDKFEDKYPQIKNQRFFGFKELSFSPGANDNSLIREKLGADVMRKAGVAAAQTAFYQVYIDFGAGEQYCGVYTMIEVVDDTMVRNEFGDNTGNIYKPESRLSSFMISAFEKKNNEEAGDFSDIQRLIKELNSAPQATDPAEWRLRMEKAMDVDAFVRWLAVNTTMVNWDSYGTAAHNYYLYNHPDRGITWIPWDHNEVMAGRGGSPLTSTNAGTTLSLSLSEVTANWPLIHYIIKDPVYQLKYREYVEHFATNVFTAEKMNLMIDHHHNMIAPYIEGPIAVESGKYTHLSNMMNFANSVQLLKDHVASRKVVVDAYLE